MPGRLFLERPLEAVAGDIGADAAGLAAEPPRRNIQPGQEVLVALPGATPRMTRMRWGLIPMGRKNARGRPVLETIVNARSETVFRKSAFEGVTRCAVPADGWYEWTGKARRKTAWEIRAADGALLWFAAICDAWAAPGGREIWQVATVTCAPSADVRDIHDRMGVLLRSEDVTEWLNADEDTAAELMRPAPDGALAVAEARGVDWAGP